MSPPTVGGVTPLGLLKLLAGKEVGLFVFCGLFIGGLATGGLSIGGLATGGVGSDCVGGTASCF